MEEVLKEDFIKDFRYGHEGDDADHPFHGYAGHVEFSECNRDELKKSYSEVANRAKAILEIGVCRNGTLSSSYVFLESKKDSTVYLGVDLSDKTFLDSKEKNVYTMQINSSDYEKIMAYAATLGVSQFDYIFIDGWHSINQCIKDWRFVTNLAPGGIVGMHDTNRHPGPNHLVKYLNTDKWILTKKCETDDIYGDNGISFAKKRV
jgi:hypothetical protein